MSSQVLDHSASHPANPNFQHQFEDLNQQYASTTFGMWVFLVQEILFFSGLFVAYGVFRNWYPEMFVAASHQLNKEMGATNTVVLLFSSFTAALAVRSSQLGKRAETGRYIVITILCACMFLVIKYFEYTHKFHAGLLPGDLFHPNAEHLKQGAEPLPENAHIFFSLYFVMTGIHGLHVVIGIGIFIWIYIRNWRGDFSKEFFTPVDLAALYWHLVDLVWIYLFPLIYLVG